MHTWEDELEDALRAISGAFLFGVPLLYTMEIWWIGNYTSPPRMLAALGITYFALLLLCYAAGFRKENSSSLSQALMDSAVGLAIAVVAATLSLAVIGALGFGQGMDTMLGRITMETIPFGIGAGISNFLVEQEENESGYEKKDIKHNHNGDSTEDAIRGTLSDAGATTLGSVIIAFAIAPTEEVELIAGRLSSPDLLALILVSLLLSYVIVFEGSFASQRKREQQQGIFQHPITETIFSYILSLFMAVLMLWLFQLISTDDVLEKWLSYTLVLGFPATLGGAAGRIAV